MTAPFEKEQHQRSWMRILAAVLIGLVGSVIIWVTTPYVNYVVLQESSIAGSYLPVGALFLILIVVLLVNPLLRRLIPNFALQKSELAIIFGMLLVASVLPGQGLLRMLPYSLANVPYAASESRRVVQAYEEMNLPPGLFPGKIAYMDVPAASDYFIRELPAGQPVPWKAWLSPLLYWGSFLTFGWLMVIGLAQIVLPQWRDNEHLPFPLLNIQQSLIEGPNKGRIFASLFRKRSFWTAVALVFMLHLLVGLNTYLPTRVPKIPLSWDINDLFSEGIFRYLPWYIGYSKIYFIFVGVTFFMPSRIGFSIWFFQILYAGYRVVGMAYTPPYHWLTITDHRTGAMWAVAAVVLWLGRAHWKRVFGSIFRTPTDEADKRNRKAAIMFLLGCAGMLWWLWQVVHVPWPWAVFLVAFAFVVSLIITRIVAEPGMVFVRLHFWYQISFIKLVPIAWLSLPVLYFARVIAVLFAMGSRVSCATMATHAVGLDREASPRRQWRFSLLLVGLLMVGLVICGGTHLWANYHHSASYDGRERPLNIGGSYLFIHGHSEMVNFREGRVSRPSYNQWAHLGFGAAVAGVLEWLCLRTPLWPLHPVGLLMVDTYYANIAWVSVFIGWLAKILVLRYGGAHFYRAARPFFIGLIMGEIFAAAFWALEPVVRILMDVPYKVIQIQPY